VLTGLVIFLNFGAGVLVQSTTTRWPAHRLIAAGLAPLLIGLIVLVASAWTSPASLPLFLVGSAVAGVGGGAIIRGSLTVVISTTSPAERAGALATYFTAGYIGVSLPVLGAGVALQYLSPRVTLLIFATAVALGILAAVPSLLRDDKPKGPSAYLNEHLADETRRLERAKRAVAENKGTPRGTFLELLSWDLEEDRDSLVRLMRELGVRPSHSRLAFAWIAGRSPVRRPVELASIQRGIENELAMWSTLRSSVGDRVHDVDFDVLITRTEGQAHAPLSLERSRS
jgi:MFS family permease